MTSTSPHLTDTTGAARLPAFPAADVQRYRAVALWGDLTLAEQFHSVALRYPDHDAVVSAEGRLSYHRLDEWSDRVAAGLHGLGLRPGDPMLFQVGNKLHSVLAWYAALKAGLIPIATLLQHRRHELGQITDRTGAVAHLVEAEPGDRFDLQDLGLTLRTEHPSLRHLLVVGAAPPSDVAVALTSLGHDLDAAQARAVVERIQDDLDPDGVAVYQLSGGTTGVPKVIPRRHAEYWYNAVAYADRLGWTPESRVAHLIPIIHNAGIVCGVHAPHSVGATLLLGVPAATPSIPMLVAEGVTDILIGHGHFESVADRAILQLAATLQRAVLSGAKVSPALFDKIEGHGVWAGQLFGMAEGFFALSRPDDPRESRLHTVGTALSPWDEVRILEPGTENDLPDGVTGELCCRGPYTLPGYLDAAEHNLIAFTADGFYRTGDLASIQIFDGRRCLSIDGRIKDVINRGGEKVNAEEIELLLLQHPGVAQAAVVAMPDVRLGEKACAYLVATGAPLSMAEVQHHLDDLGVAKFKWPERLEWIDDLPRTQVNKIDKKALRQRVAANLPDGAA
jgi:2,3-dihydroxybenzoate-AMP ligase